MIILNRVLIINLNNNNQRLTRGPKALYRKYTISKNCEQNLQAKPLAVGRLNNICYRTRITKHFKNKVKTGERLASHPPSAKQLQQPHFMVKSKTISEMKYNKRCCSDCPPPESVLVSTINHFYKGTTIMSLNKSYKTWLPCSVGTQTIMAKEKKNNSTYCDIGLIKHEQLLASGVPIREITSKRCQTDAKSHLLNPFPGQPDPKVGQAQVSCLPSRLFCTVICVFLLFCLIQTNCFLRFRCKPKLELFLYRLPCNVQTTTCSPSMGGF